MILIFWLCSLSLRVDLEFVNCLWIIPITHIVLIIPVTIADLGVREGVLTYLMVLQGINITDAVTLALVFRVVTTLYSILTGLAWLKPLNIDTSEKQQRDLN